MTQPVYPKHDSFFNSAHIQYASSCEHMSLSKYELAVAEITLILMHVGNNVQWWQFVTCCYLLFVVVMLEPQKDQNCWNYSTAGTATVIENNF